MGRSWTAQVALSWVTVPSALAVVQWSNNTGTTDGGCRQGGDGKSIASLVRAAMLPEGVRVQKPFARYKDRVERYSSSVWHVPCG